MSNFRWYVLPILGLPLYSMTMALEACTTSSSTEPSGTSENAITCLSGETAKKLSSGDVCCRALADGTEQCRAPTDDAPGTPCTTIGDKKPGTSTVASFDVCVEEECSGDRRCTEFPTSIDKATGTLVCTSVGGVSQWMLDVSGGSSHKVERACLVERTDVCWGPGYSSTNPQVYGYSSAYLNTYAQVCGYGGYGYGPNTVSVRKLYLISSTCSTGGGTIADCPVDDL
jgi:hypothetical protein